MKRKILIIAFFCSSLSCKKYDQKDDVLPPVTSTGADNFGFLFNNTVWVRHNIPSLSPKYTVKYSAFRGLYLTCQRRNRTNSNRVDYSDLVFKVLTLGERSLNIQNGDQVHINIYKPDEFDEYFLESGTLKISRLDTVNHIISGEFNVNVKMRQIDQKASITQGRFDIVYDPDMKP